MSDLLDIQAQLRDTSEAIARSEQAVATDPRSGAARAMLRSFEKRRDALETEFSAAARELGVDICSYRFLSDIVRPAMAHLCNALIDFQALYSYAYDAIKSGAKKRGRRLPQEVVDESSFGLAYTFSGSIGMVLTFDNDKHDLFGTAMDESMDEIGRLADARSTADILASGKRLGIPAIRAAHKWATTHATAKIGADIGWKKGEETRMTIFLESQSFQELASLISATTETVEEEIEIAGRLLGADVKRRSFHLELPGAPDIKGTFSNLIDDSRTFEVGRLYKMTVKKRVKVYYSTDEEEDATYSLLMATIASPAQ